MPRDARAGRAELVGDGHKVARTPARLGAVVVLVHFGEVVGEDHVQDLSEGGGQG